MGYTKQRMMNRIHPINTKNGKIFKLSSNALSNYMFVDSIVIEEEKEEDGEAIGKILSV